MTPSSCSVYQPLALTAELLRRLQMRLRGVICVAVQGVNAAAAHLGIKAEYAWGGSGRSSSLTDLVVRKSGEQSDLQQLSRLVLGAAEIKGSWQFSCSEARL